jgi:hypothetical protein
VDVAAHTKVIIPSERWSTLLEMLADDDIKPQFFKKHTFKIENVSRDDKSKKSNCYNSAVGLGVSLFAVVGIALH